MKISHRLETVASFVARGSFIADIGSDHATVPIYLYENGVIEHAMAVENKIGPYSRMVKALEEAGYLEQSYPSLSSGIEKLMPEVDTLVIAGMGARLILSILESHKEKLSNVKTIILDAHNERELLFEPLRGLGYSLASNSFIEEENVSYDVMKLVKEAKVVPYTPKEALFGPLNLKNKPEAWVKFWKKEEGRLSKILETNNLPEDKRNEYSKMVEMIKEALNEN